MWSLIMGAATSIEEEEEEEQEQESRRFSEPVVNTEMSLPTSSDVLVSVSPRQQGDGMEEIPPAHNPSSRPEGAATSPVPQSADRGNTVTLVSKSSAGGATGVSDTPARSIYLPDTGIKLAKLPPIRDKVDLPPRQPTAPLFKETPRVYPRGSYPPAVTAAKKAAKEPKFVPYEPYKGAVKSFATNFASPKRPTAPMSPPQKSSTALRQSSVTDTDADVDIYERGEEVVVSGELEQNYRTMLEIKEKEIERLRQSLQAAEKQLKIQTQVNSEVKKLLVASVGEDIEARVDFLTQDKARLAADVIHYNNKISRDWEEKEALHVESDVWRSKFLASTLIVEEVSRGRQVLATRCEEIEHAARRLILERNQIRSTLADCQASVSALLHSFDPLGATSTTQAATLLNNNNNNNADVTQLAAMLSRSCASLRSRLLGESATASPVAPAANLPPFHLLDSPAERDLKRLLQQRPVEAGWRVPEQASDALTKGARPLLLKLGDQTAQGRTEFGNCSHCHGTVHVV